MEQMMRMNVKIRGVVRVLVQHRQQQQRAEKNRFSCLLSRSLPFTSLYSCNVHNFKWCTTFGEKCVCVCLCLQMWFYIYVCETLLFQLVFALVCFSLLFVFLFGVFFLRFFSSCIFLKMLGSFGSLCNNRNAKQNASLTPEWWRSV